MMRYIALLLLLTASAGAQVPTGGFAFWKSGAAPSFSPADIDSLKGWYVAADLADSLGKSSGDTTYIWPNRARWLKPHTLNDLFQTTDALKPTYHDSTYSQVNFDGADDAIRSLAPKMTQPVTVVWVGRYFKPVGSNRFWWDNFTNADGAFTFYNGPGNPRLNAGTDGPTANLINADSTYLVIGYYEGASSELYVNGIKTTGDAGTTTNLIGLTLGAARVGVSANFYGPNRVHECVVVHRKLTAGELASIQSYLATKYGITLP